MESPGQYSLARVLKCGISLGVFLVSRLRDKLLRLSNKLPKATYVVLYYHSIPAEHRTKFAAQMDMLSRYSTPLSLGSEVMVLPAGVNGVAVTFDDALQNLIENALPELKTRKIPATIFAISGAMGKTFGAPEYPEPVMSPEELQNLPDDLITVGSHTATHPFLPSISKEAARWELAQSKAQLTEILQKEILLFSFPFGGFTEELVDLCREVGYHRVFTTLPTLTFLNSLEFAVGRIRVDPTDWPLEYRLKLAGAYRWLPRAFAMKKRLLTNRTLARFLPKRIQFSEYRVPQAKIQ